MSNVARGKATAHHHEWQTDALAAASASNAVIEGDDATTNTVVPTARFANYTQILTKVPRVSKTQREVNSAGRRDELSYQIAKMGREIKRDLEASLTSRNKAAAGDSGSAATMAGLGAWLFGNVVKPTANSSGTTAIITSGAPTTAVSAGTAGTFIESDLKSCIKLCWDDGGDPGVVMVGAFNKMQASGFSGIGTQYRDVQPSAVAPGSIVGAADLYVSDFGTHQIVANRFQNANEVYVLDLEYWSVDFLYPFTQEPLAKTGLSDRVLISTQVTLAALNPNASGKVFNVTSS
ncbi:MAG: head protein [Desulfurellales bacterium]|nr:MAG: head protein [Desulfurellales bacterium]